MLYVINNQSSTDVITNSSSEIYAVTDRIQYKSDITRLFTVEMGMANISINKFNEYFSKYFEYSGMFMGDLSEDDIDALVSTLKRIWDIPKDSNPWLIYINDNDTNNRLIVKEILGGKLISDMI